MESRSEFLIGMFLKQNVMQESRANMTLFQILLSNLCTNAPLYEFINRIRAEHIDRTVADRNLPDAKYFHEKPDIEEIIEHVEKTIPEDFALSKRVQLYICHKYSGQKLNDIGIHFGIGESGVSQASRRVAMQADKDKKLKKRINKILSDLNLSRV